MCQTSHITDRTDTEKWVLWLYFCQFSALAQNKLHFGISEFFFMRLFLTKFNIGGHMTKTLKRRNG